MDIEEYLKIHTNCCDSSDSSVGDESFLSSLDEIYYKHQPKPVAVTQSTVIINAANDRDDTENKDWNTINSKMQNAENLEGRSAVPQKRKKKNLKRNKKKWNLTKKKVAPPNEFENANPLPIRTIIIRPAKSSSSSSEETPTLKSKHENNQRTYESSTSMQMLRFQNSSNADEPQEELTLKLIHSSGKKLASLQTIVIEPSPEQQSLFQLQVTSQPEMLDLETSDIKNSIDIGGNLESTGSSSNIRRKRTRKQSGSTIKKISNGQSHENMSNIKEPEGKLKMQSKEKKETAINVTNGRDFGASTTTLISTSNELIKKESTGPSVPSEHPGHYTQAASSQKANRTSSTPLTSTRLDVISDKSSNFHLSDKPNQFFDGFGNSERELRMQAPVWRQFIVEYYIRKNYLKPKYCSNFSENSSNPVAGSFGLSQWSFKYFNSIPSKPSITWGYNTTLGEALYIMKKGVSTDGVSTESSIVKCKALGQSSFPSISEKPLATAAEISKVKKNHSTSSPFLLRSAEATGQLNTLIKETQNIRTNGLSGSTNSTDSSTMKCKALGQSPFSSQLNKFADTAEKTSNVKRNHSTSSSFLLGPAALEQLNTSSEETQNIKTNDLSGSANSTDLSTVKCKALKHSSLLSESNKVVATVAETPNVSRNYSTSTLSVLESTLWEDLNITGEEAQNIDINDSSVLTNSNGASSKLTARCKSLGQPSESSKLVAAAVDTIKVKIPCSTSRSSLLESPAFKLLSTKAEETKNFKRKDVLSKFMDSNYSGDRSFLSKATPQQHNIIKSTINKLIYKEDFDSTKPLEALSATSAEYFGKKASPSNTTIGDTLLESNSNEADFASSRDLDQMNSSRLFRSKLPIFSNTQPFSDSFEESLTSLTSTSSSFQSIIGTPSEQNESATSELTSSFSIREPIQSSSLHQDRSPARSGIGTCGLIQEFPNARSVEAKKLIPKEASSPSSTVYQISVENSTNLRKFNKCAVGVPTATADFLKLNEQIVEPVLHNETPNYSLNRSSFSKSSTVMDFESFNTELLAKYVIDSLKDLEGLNFERFEYRLYITMSAYVRKIRKNPESEAVTGLPGGVLNDPKYSWIISYNEDTINWALRSTAREWSKVLYIPPRRSSIGRSFNYYRSFNSYQSFQETENREHEQVSESSHLEHSDYLNRYFLSSNKRKTKLCFCISCCILL